MSSDQRGEFVFWIWLGVMLLMAWWSYCVQKQRKTFHAILKHLEENGPQTGLEMIRAGISSRGVIHVYLTRLEDKDYVSYIETTDDADTTRMKWAITPEGRDWLIGEEIS